MSGFLDAILGFFKRKDDGTPAPAARPAPPDDGKPESLRRWLVAMGLNEQRASALAALALPGIRMRVETMAVDDWPQVGLSKLGGTPDVPADFTWPRHDGLPLMFLGQVNLGELAGMPVARALPGDGMLAFFHGPGPRGAWGFDPKDRGSARVLWFRDTKSLRRATRPAELTPDGVFAAGRLALREELTLPDHEAPEVDALALDEEEDELYMECVGELHMRGTVDTQHLLLGHAAPIQGDMRLECQLVTNGLYAGDARGYEDPRRAALDAGAREWRLLAQVDSDGAVDMMWGDAGMLYFWIRERDLAARRFDEAWMVLQCS